LFVKLGFQALEADIGARHAEVRVRVSQS
jgi:hypothetical protein